MVKRVAVAVVVAVAACAVVAILLLLLLGLGSGGGGGTPSGAPGTVARPPEVVWDGRVLRVEYLEYSGNSLVVRVNCTNRVGGEWYVQPMRQFYLVLDSGEELRPRDTSLPFGFYYVKRRESIDFEVLFDVRPGAKPVKLVYRGDVDLEVPLTNAPVFRGVRLERSIMVSHIGPHDPCRCSIDIEHIQTFEHIPMSITSNLDKLLVPLNSNTTSITLKLTNMEMACTCRVTIKTVNGSIKVLSFSPKEFELKPGEHRYVEIQLEVPEGISSAKLHIDIEVKPVARPTG